MSHVSIKQSVAQLHGVNEVAGLRLVPFQQLDEQHVEMVWQWREHPAIKAWGYTQEPLLLPSHRTFVAGLAQRIDSFFWLAFNTLEDDAPCGIINLNRISWDHRHGWLGVFSNPITPRPGMGTRLMQALDYLAFDVAKLHSLRLEVFHTNERAIALYCKCGFTEEGRLRQHVCINGQWLDALQFGKLASEVAHFAAPKMGG